MRGSIVVRPGGGVGHRIGGHGLAEAVEPRVDWIVVEDLRDHGEGVRIEILFGDERDGLMAVAAPGASARAMESASCD